jgi:5-methylthioribose kinase
MILLDETTLTAYLRDRRLLARNENCRVEALSGGVSNVVLRIEPEHGPPFVVKQARERLRTDVPWFSRLDRVFRETAVMGALRPLLPSGVIPEILDEDRENYAYAMQAVDANHVVWKRELLAGLIREEIAVCLAEYLSAIHGRTAGAQAIAEEFDDREVFAQLRVDPFYRHLIRTQPELRSRISDLIDEMAQTRACLVHADFSPKNVLVVDRSGPTVESDAGVGKPQVHVTLIDFETGHYGDPAFDLGFFLSHLFLKGVRAGSGAGGFLRLAGTFWNRYQSGIAELSQSPGFQPRDLERRTVTHLAACARARIDGTSPVDYLPNAADRHAVREFSSGIFADSIVSLTDAQSLLLDCLPEKSASFDAPASQSPQSS